MEHYRHQPTRVDWEPTNIAGIPLGTGDPSPVS